MSHTFYGPWLIGALEPIVELHWADYQLIVAGSSGADGGYITAEDFSLHVDGDTWALGALFRSGTGWMEMSNVRPVTSFDRLSNLRVHLTFVGRFGRTVALAVQCVSQDPALNPDPRGDPYDFSLPEG